MHLCLYRYVLRQVNKGLPKTDVSVNKIREQLQQSGSDLVNLFCIR